MTKLLDSDKLLSKEAEAATLASMSLERDCVPGVLAIIGADDFYLPEHQTLFSALVELYAASAPTDAVALRTQLKEMNELERIGGVEYIARILDSVPSAASVGYYARVVKERRQYRDMVQGIERMKAVLDEPLTVAEQAQAVQDIALGIDADKPEREFFELSEHATKVVGAIPDRQEILPTGFRSIDRVIGGVCPGDLVILAGRPAMGKSALALDFTLNMAKGGKAVVFFSLEMTHKALIERAACALAGVNSQTLRVDKPPQEDFAKVCEQGFVLEKLNIVFHEGGVTPEKQRAFIKARKKTHGVDVVFIDYLQLMGAGQRTANRVDEVTTISRKLKRLAIRERVPVIALSQLNRQVESREHHRPRLSDLRDSGSIEQDADVVMLLHREDFYRRSESPETTAIDGTAELTVAKNRRGPTGIARLVFVEEYVKFGELALQGTSDRQAGYVDG